ncbi:hypothetical protein HHK36_011527 [Tetracentron sinense]|uniref:Spindle and kinetochore-associated protein 3 n=1 Tax=Tetracentron sinense TaxID=13715 RepID=A0A835DHA3_TETSI|nr:hypothetical protein HHK36_011527 [Tetracentron sinense]
MAFGTVSFEELLGHCNEVYKKNQSDIVELEDRLTTFGYIPEIEVDDEDEVSGLSTPVGLYSKLLDPEDGPVSVAGSIMKRLEEDPLYDDDELREMKGLYQPTTKLLGTTGGRNYSTLGSLGKGDDDTKSVGACKSFINVSKDDYESLPSYMKSLASWEIELHQIGKFVLKILYKACFARGGGGSCGVPGSQDVHAAVEKMNSYFSKQEKLKGGNFFYQDDLASMGLGPKGRSYLLLLLRMNRLVVETVDGSICYRIL